MNLGITTVITTDFDDAVQRTRKALAEQGFGILTEIDIKSTLKQKIDADIENYVILGACNPPLANSALGVNRQIGLLLPCNVVVREDTARPGRIVVEAMNPQLMVEVSGEPELSAVAAEATERLNAAIASLNEPG